MIANDEYPDMIYAKGSATDLYQAGALIDMTDLIEKYGPNIKKMYGAEMEKLNLSAFLRRCKPENPDNRRKLPDSVGCIKRERL